jgi:hypothetical protein
VEAGELLHSTKAAGRLATSGPQHSSSGLKAAADAQKHALKLPLVPSKLASPIRSSSPHGGLKGFQAGQGKAACEKSAYDGPEHLTMIQVGSEAVDLMTYSSLSCSAAQLGCLHALQQLLVGSCHQLVRQTPPCAPCSTCVLYCCLMVSMVHHPGARWCHHSDGCSALLLQRCRQARRLDLL